MRFQQLLCKFSFLMLINIWKVIDEWTTRRRTKNLIRFRIQIFYLDLPHKAFFFLLQIYQSSVMLDFDLFK